jgi:DNA-binding CsgD family transcriptional regulator
MSVTSAGIERRDMPLLAPLPVRRRDAVDDGGARTDDPALTKRQRQVVDGLIRGLTNKEIAAELGVGPDAVKRTISRLLIKLNAPSRTALVQIALRTSAARLARSSGANALSLLDAAPIPALVTRGEQHLIEYANPAARSVLRLADVGVRLVDVLAPDASNAVGALADATYRACEGQSAQTVPLRHDDTETAWRCADVYARPLRDGADRLAGLIVFLIDVTAHPSRPLTGQKS